MAALKERVETGWFGVNKCVGVGWHVLRGTVNLSSVIYNVQNSAYHVNLTLKIQGSFPNSLKCNVFYLAQTQQPIPHHQVDEREFQSGDEIPKINSTMQDRDNKIDLICQWHLSIHNCPLVP